MSTADGTAAGSASRWGLLWGARPAEWALSEDQQVATYEAALDQVGMVPGTRVRDIAFCTRYCGCVLDALMREDLLDEVVAGSGDVGLGDRIEEVTDMCMAEAEGAIDEGGRE